MKIRIADRLFVALAGLVLISLGAGIVAETFFSVPLTGAVGTFLAWKNGNHQIVAGTAAAILLLLGIYCVMMLFRHHKGKRGFVLQKTDSGELSISIRAIEGLVQKCVDQHEELHVTHTSLQNTRDGLIIRLRVSLAGGINIPLAVSALQRQIRQYITACSGVDVKEVRVQVETSSGKADDSPYMVPDMSQPVMTHEEPVPAVPRAAEAAPEKAEPEKRPLHQRLFGQEEQPAIMPMPPEMTAEEPAPAEEPVMVEEPAPEVAVEEETDETEIPEEAVVETMSVPEDEEGAAEEEDHEIAE